MIHWTTAVIIAVFSFYMGQNGSINAADFGLFIGLAVCAAIYRFASQIKEEDEFEGLLSDGSKGKGQKIYYEFKIGEITYRNEDRQRLIDSINDKSPTVTK